jgi:hypothetical protein
VSPAPANQVGRVALGLTNSNGQLGAPFGRSHHVQWEGLAAVDQRRGLAGTIFGEEDRLAEFGDRVIDHGFDPTIAVAEDAANGALDLEVNHLATRHRALELDDQVSPALIAQGVLKDSCGGGVLSQLHPWAPKVVQNCPDAALEELDALFTPCDCCCPGFVPQDQGRPVVDDLIRAAN